MKDYLKFIALITFMTLGITGCYNTLLPFRIPTKQPEIPNNQIKKSIPRYPDKKVFAFYKFAKQKQKQLNLSIPENGYDSLLIRIWFSYPEGLQQFGELVELSIDSNNQRTVKYTRMQIFFNPSRDCEIINFHKDTLINEPRNGWANFMDRMNTLGIIKLPTIENIKFYRALNDGGVDYKHTSLTVSVEVATKNEYRFFQYNGFEKYKGIDEVKRMYSFIKYLRTEFYMNDIDNEWYKD